MTLSKTLRLIEAYEVEFLSALQKNNINRALEMKQRQLTETRKANQYFRDREKQCVEVNPDIFLGGN